MVPSFRSPWEAHVFALTLQLHEAGHFSWPEWAQRLGAEFAAAKARGTPDTGVDYYHYWLAALEKLVAEKNLLSPSELDVRKRQWAQAAEQTPHGKPIEIKTT